MRWRDLISQTYAAGEHAGRPDLPEGVKVERIAHLESQLGLRLPSALRELLQEADGVGQMDFSDGKWELSHTEVWSCDRISEENMNMRADPDGPPPPPGAPETAPLYFARAGVDGILFAFLVRAAGPEDPAVYAYYPIEGEWCLISPSLKVHLQGWTV